MPLFSAPASAQDRTAVGIAWARRELGRIAGSLRAAPLGGLLVLADGAGKRLVWVGRPREDFTDAERNRGRFLGLFVIPLVVRRELAVLEPVRDPRPVAAREKAFCRILGGGGEIFTVLRFFGWLATRIRPTLRLFRVNQRRGKLVVYNPLFHILYAQSLAELAFPTGKIVVQGWRPKADREGL